MIEKPPPEIRATDPPRDGPFAGKTALAAGSGRYVSSGRSVVFTGTSGLLSNGSYREAAARLM
jgi:hypothetical protein